MNGYLGTAFLVLVVAFPLGLVLLVPATAWAYRSSRGPTVVGLLAAVVALGYVLALWAYTVLPLPQQDPCGDPAIAPQLTPFAFVDELAGAGSPLGWVTDPAATITALNVALFVPLGAGVVVLTGRRRPVAVAAAVGFGVSLTVEIVQLTGTLGLYRCAYRLFDVDDLITNTTGAVLGAILATLLGLERRRRRSATSQPVTGRRVALAAAIDVFTVLGAYLVLTVVVVLAADIAGRGSAVGRLSSADGLLAFTLGVPVTAALLVLPLVASGATPGRWAVAIRMVNEGGSAPRRSQNITLVLAGGGGLGWLWVAQSVFSSPVLLGLCGVWGAVSIWLMTRPGHAGLSGLAARLRPADGRAIDERIGAPDWTQRLDPDAVLRLLAGVVALTLAALIASVWALSSLGPGAPVALVPIVGTMAAAQVVASGFLIINGIQMLRRESRSLGNLLSLLAGVGSAAAIALVVAALLVGPDPVRAVAAALSAVAAYLSLMFAGVVVAGRRFGRAPVREPVDAVIALGSRVLGARVPPLLAGRLRTAQTVLEDAIAAGHDPVLVCSGGRGPGEDVSEAHAMRSWLLDHGVAPERVITEEESRTTQENLQFSLALLGASPNRHVHTAVVATNGYHVLRAATLAKDLNTTVIIRAAPTASYFLPSALLREYVALLLRDRSVHVLMCVCLAALAATTVLS